MPRDALTSHARDAHPSPVARAGVRQPSAVRPGKARNDDHGLAIFEEAGFAGADADRAAATVFIFVLGSALGPAAHVSLNRQLSRNGGDAEQLLADTMARTTEIAMRFPRLRERLHTTGADYAAAPESGFEFGLQAILDGFEARLAAGLHGRRERASPSQTRLTWPVAHLWHSAPRRHRLEVPLVRCVI